MRSLRRAEEREQLFRGRKRHDRMYVIRLNSGGPENAPSRGGMPKNVAANRTESAGLPRPILKIAR